MSRRPRWRDARRLGDRGARRLDRCRVRGQDGRPRARRRSTCGHTRAGQRPSPMPRRAGSGRSCRWFRWSTRSSAYGTSASSRRSRATRSPPHRRRRQHASATCERRSKRRMPGDVLSPTTPVRWLRRACRSTPSRAIRQTESSPKPDDLVMMRAVLAAAATQLEGAAHPSGPRSGIGFDAHRLAEGRPMRVGGLSWEGESRGPLGHSDGDAALHALIDALLGAANLGDVGTLFPADEAAWEGVDSADLVGRAVERIASRALAADGRGRDCRGGVARPSRPAARSSATVLAGLLGIARRRGVGQGDDVRRARLRRRRGNRGMGRRHRRAGRMTRVDRRATAGCRGARRRPRGAPAPRSLRPPGPHRSCAPSPMRRAGSACRSTAFRPIS